MSWSLLIQHGDLGLGGNQLGQVTGPHKLTQDLRCAILEHRGNDDMHPTFGSLIDGGLDDLGNDIPSLIGGDNWQFIQLRVQQELTRILNQYQQQQVQRAKTDRYNYGQSTLSNDELLATIDSIEMQAAQDKLLVTVNLTTGGNETFALNVPVAANVSTLS